MDLEYLLADPLFEELITEGLHWHEYHRLARIAVRVHNTLVRPAPDRLLAAHPDLRGKTFTGEPQQAVDDGHQQHGSESSSE